MRFRRIIVAMVGVGVFLVFLFVCSFVVVVVVM